MHIIKREISIEFQWALSWLGLYFESPFHFVFTLRMSNCWLQSIETHDSEPSQILGNINFTESDVPISPFPDFNGINFGLLERKLIL
jgi:hypothetical protein